MRLIACLLTTAIVAAAVADEPPKNPFRDGSGRASAEPAKVEPLKNAPRVLRAADAGVGRLIPDVAFTDLAGKPGTLSDFKGSKLLVVALTNTNCPLCKKYTPTLAPLEKEYTQKFELPKPIAVKAQGTMPYQNVAVPTDYDDRWVRALEVQPTAREVVHHVLVFAIPKGLPRALGEGQGFFAAYVPGNNTLIYPDGYAKKLPKGATLVFQIHYTPNGTATTDRTRLGLVFAPEAPRHEVRVAELSNKRFAIPPGAENHPLEARMRSVPFDARVLSFFPHAHLRGKAARYEVRLPDGTTKTLLDVPHYDFNWQLNYRYAEPVAVPRGSSLTYTAWYDNSAKNPANPDPKRTVGWGQQTYDEMHLGYLEYVLDR